MDNEKPHPIWGAKAIAAEIGVSERQAYWLLENGHLPGQKIGTRWVSYSDKLHAKMRGETEAA